MRQIDEKTKAQVEGLLMLAAKRNKECEQIRDMVVELLEIDERGRDRVDDAIWGSPDDGVDKLIELLEYDQKKAAERDRAARGV